ncbi:MAG: hypothetical protein LRY74_10805, partial [Shewanella xiamenensis]|nr:hypothetical protein [Shewanella xiamenensis]
MEEAFAQGNLHAGIKLNEIFGDNRIFEAQVNTEKLDRTLSWDPLDIARKAEVVADDALIASHVRLLDRDQVSYDWQHYLPLIERKPGALRNG